MAMNPDATLRAIAGEREVRGALPRELITTDRVLQRWAVGSGSGLPSDDWDDTPRAKPPPLPDDVAITVDQCIEQAPERTQKLIHLWYRTPKPREVIALEIGISKRNVYRVRNIYLAFMRGRFEGSGNAELIHMVRVIG